MNKETLAAFWLFLVMLAGLFFLARQGDPLAIAALSVIGTLVIMVVTFLGIMLLQGREERRFRANAEENAQLLQLQARAQSQLSLSQQRQMAVLNTNQPALPAGEPGYSFGFAPDAWAGFEENVLDVDTSTST